MRRRMRRTTSGSPIGSPWRRRCAAACPCRSPMRSATRSPGARSRCDSSTTENSSRQGQSMSQKAEGNENKLVLETTKGPITIALRPDLAPAHVARIKELVGEGFYDGVAFHRVIDGFMAQTGCPHGTGTGGSGQKLKAEFSKERHVRGTVSMARSQNPDSGDSQFFICFAESKWLDGQYTVWGKVTAGMENVDKIKRGEPVHDPDSIIAARMAGDAT